MFGQYYTPEKVAFANGKTTYNDFRIELESGPHGAIHSGVGGDMSPATSPNGILPIQSTTCRMVEVLTCFQIRYSSSIIRRLIDFGGYGKMRAQIGHMNLVVIK